MKMKKFACQNSKTTRFKKTLKKNSQTQIEFVNMVQRGKKCQR